MKRMMSERMNQSENQCERDDEIMIECEFVNDDEQPSAGCRVDRCDRD